MQQRECEQFPTGAGTYALFLHVKRPQVLRIGRFGSVSMAAGNYVYVGSALGPGGLRARLRRHLCGSGTRHWHIDYVRAIADVEAIWYAASRKRLECRWSQVLAAMPATHIPVPGFGAGDCSAGCQAHLILMPDGIELDQVRTVLTDVTKRTATATVDFVTVGK